MLYYFLSKDQSLNGHIKELQIRNSIFKSHKLEKYVYAKEIIKELRNISPIFQSIDVLIQRFKDQYSHDQKMIENYRKQRYIKESLSALNDLHTSFYRWETIKMCKRYWNFLYFCEITFEKQIGDITGIVGETFDYLKFTWYDFDAIIIPETFEI